MGWFLRKSFRLLPGIKLNLSKSGPRLSVGVPGARESIDLGGKTRIYGGLGPVRYQSTRRLTPPDKSEEKGKGLLGLIRAVFGR
jgi:hypothetical protein